MTARLIHSKAQQDKGDLYTRQKNVTISNIIRFEETTKGDRVLVRHGAPGIGCWSMVGKIGGTQNLYLGTDAGE